MWFRIICTFGGYRNYCPYSVDQAAGLHREQAEQLQQKAR